MASDTLTAPTRRVLTARLDHQPSAPRVLSASQMVTLTAACLRLIPDPALVERTALAARFEELLGGDARRGWRYAKAPEDLVLHRAGLDALDAAAQTGSARGFAALAADEQDALLTAAASGEVLDAAGRPLDTWFEELLSAVVKIFYAHPMVQVAIGYDGMADAHGATAVGPDAIAAERAS